MTEKKKRTARIVLEVLGGLLFGVAALGGLGIYFLSSGPVSVPALTPMLEEELNPEGSPYTVSIQETRIVWGGWDRALDVVAANVTVREAGHDGNPVAVLPEVSVGVSFQALLAGEARLTSLEILHPAVTLVRDPINGISIAFDTDFGGEDQGEQDPRDEGPRIDIVPGAARFRPSAQTRRGSADGILGSIQLAGRSGAVQHPAGGDPDR